jgi:hypothetical protein
MRLTLAVRGPDRDPSAPRGGRRSRTPSTPIAPAPDHRGGRGVKDRNVSLIVTCAAVGFSPSSRWTFAKWPPRPVAPSQAEQIRTELDPAGSPELTKPSPWVGQCCGGRSLREPALAAAVVRGPFQGRRSSALCVLLAGIRLRGGEERRVGRFDVLRSEGSPGRRLTADLRQERRSTQVHGDRPSSGSPPLRSISSRSRAEVGSPASTWRRWDASTRTFVALHHIRQRRREGPPDPTSVRTPPEPTVGPQDAVRSRAPSLDRRGSGDEQVSPGSSPPRNGREMAQRCSRPDRSLPPSASRVPRGADRRRDPSDSIGVSVACACPRRLAAASRWRVRLDRGQRTAPVPNATVVDPPSRRPGRRTNELGAARPSSEAVPIASPLDVVADAGSSPPSARDVPSRRRLGPPMRRQHGRPWRRRPRPARRPRAARTRADRSSRRLPS